MTIERVGVCGYSGCLIYFCGYSGCLIYFSFSEKEHTGGIELDVNNNTVYLTGDKGGLLALASKLIEVANCDVDGYHKHLDEIELPNVSIKPDNIELNIGKSNI